MKFGEYLKKERERNKLTQDVAADKLGIVPKTLQNWEKDILPNKDCWNNIIQLYGSNKEEFFDLYKKEVFEETNKCFYLPIIVKYILNQLSVLNFTEKEQSLYGMLLIYKRLENLPYEYVQSNYFDILNANDTLKEKLNKEISISILENEYFISKDIFEKFRLEKLKTDSKNLFNVYKFTKKDIIELFKYLNNDKHPDSDRKNFMKNIELLINVFENNLDEKLLIGKTNSTELVYNINKDIECLIKTDFPHEGIIFKEVLPFINVIDEETIKSIEEQKLYQEKLEDYWKYPGKYDNCEPKEPRYEYKLYITLKDETKELIKWLKKE